MGSKYPVALDQVGLGAVTPSFCTPEPASPVCASCPPVGDGSLGSGHISPGAAGTMQRGEDATLRAGRCRSVPRPTLLNAVPRPVPLLQAHSPEGGHAPREKEMNDTVARSWCWPRDQTTCHPRVRVGEWGDRSPSGRASHPHVHPADLTSWPPGKPSMSIPKAGGGSSGAET